MAEPALPRGSRGWLFTPRRTLSLAGHEVAWFTVYAILGVVAGVLAIVTIVLREHAFGWRPFALVATLLVASPIWMALKHAVWGRAPRVALHDAAATLATSVLAALALGLRVPVVLDAVAIGLLLVIGIGRIGCHHAGCCHGRPHRWGVRYPAGRLVPAADGFAGVPLAPVQVVEALACVPVAGVAALVLPAGPAGAGALAVGIGYGVVRVATESRRGDPDRPRWAGVSHAAWTAAGLVLACAGGLVVAGRPGWAAAGVGLLALAGVLHAGGRRVAPDLVAAALALGRDGAVQASGGTPIPRVVSDLRLSAGAVPGGGWHLTCSKAVPSLPSRGVPADAARADLAVRLARLADEVASTRHESWHLVPAASPGVGHVVFRAGVEVADPTFVEGAHQARVGPAPT